MNECVSTRLEPHSTKLSQATRQVQENAVNYKSSPLGVAVRFKPLHYNTRRWVYLFGSSHFTMILSIILACWSPCCVAPRSSRRDLENSGKKQVSCASCGNTLCAMKKCTGCNLAHYCNRECQLKDWKQHKVVCRSSQRH